MVDKEGRRVKCFTPLANGGKDLNMSICPGKRVIVKQFGTKIENRK
jgi:hypothetical protein